MVTSAPSLPAVLDASPEEAGAAAVAALLDALPALVYRRRLDEQLSFAYASAGCAALTGYGPAELAGDGAVSFVALVHADDRAALVSAITHALETGASYCCSYRLRRRDGSFRWVVDCGVEVERGLPGRRGGQDGGAENGRQDAGAPDGGAETERGLPGRRGGQDARAPNGGGTGELVGVIVPSPGPAALPATGREQGAAAAVAAERNRLARELHDTVTQSLYGVLLFADAGRRQVRAGQLEGACATFDQIEGVGKQGLREMRLLLHRLRPNLLATEGLEAALAERLAAVERCLGVRYRLEVTGTLALDIAAEEAVYYVALEALNNALRHSRGSAVTVRLRGGGPGAVLWVMDDGRGFEPEAALAGSGLGLKTMGERLAKLGGRVRYDSAPGQGARVRARVPCAAWRERRAARQPRPAPAKEGPR
jgi:signal transduction histidine kinase